jgi:preprotein translocase subunit SecY
MTLFGVTEASKGFWGGFYRFVSPNGWFYPVMLFVLIIAFAYFYITISFNPVEVSNNLKKNGGMIPGIRQGRPTAEYISKILSKITLLGALFLSIIAILPIIANPLVITPILEVILGAGNDATIQSLASSLTFGGTSLLIVVGVALETARELEAQLTMRNYKGFLS